MNPKAKLIVEDLLSHGRELPPVEGSGYRWIESTSFSRILEIGRHGFMTLSAYRPDFDYGDEVSKGRLNRAGFKKPLTEEHLYRFRSLLTDITRHGLGFLPIIGKWRDDDETEYHDELSVIVPYRNTVDAFDPPSFDEEAYAESVSGLAIANSTVFYDLMMDWLIKYDQTAGLFCPPPKTAEDKSEVYMVYSGLRDEPKGHSVLMGPFTPTNFKDQFVSALIRANRTQTADEEKVYTYPWIGPKELKLSSFAIGIPREGWSSQGTAGLSHLFNLRRG